MIALLVLQFALPLVLIGWMALAPQRTLFGFWIQSIASAAALWAMAMLGIWLLPPWWAPDVFGAALAMATGTALWRVWHVGDWLRSVGNSGNTSEPHLHVHVQRPGPDGAPLAGDPLPVLFGGRFPVRGDRIESP